MQEELNIEAAIKSAIGDQAINNIIQSVKLKALEEENATLKARIKELEARPEPLDEVADRDLRNFTPAGVDGTG